MQRSLVAESLPVPAIARLQAGAVRRAAENGVKVELQRVAAIGMHAVAEADADDSSADSAEPKRERRVHPARRLLRSLRPNRPAVMAAVIRVETIPVVAETDRILRCKV
jgi:hypothetical protein